MKLTYILFRGFKIPGARFKGAPVEKIMGKTKTKNTKVQSEKYVNQNKLAAARQQKRRDNMTEEQKEEYRKKARERYNKRKAEKRVKLINELSKKEQREKRKRWKKDSKRYRDNRKMQKKAIENTPPMSEEEEASQQETRQKISGRKKVRRDKAKAYRELKKKDNKIKDLERKLAKYKKQIQRQEKKKITPTLVSPSPSKRVTEVIGNQRVTTPVKKQLFVGFALEKQLKTQIKSISPKTKESQIFRKVIGSKILRKYRVQNELKHILSYKFNKHINNSNKINVKYSRKSYNTVKVRDQRLLQGFFENDSVSKMCPGKKDVVKQGKFYKQRRILLDSMKNLYSKFVSEHGPKVSYTTFTRVRPFWVQPPNSRDRETCACIVHENMQLLVNALKQASIVPSSNLKDLVESVVCSTDNDTCMSGLCPGCKSKKVAFNFDQDEELKFEQWVLDSEVKVIKGVEKTVRRTVKREKAEKLSKVKNLFEKSVCVFKKHVHNMKHQAKSYKILKNQLQDGELIYQIDFSQNYVAKYGTEVQATHFGASKRQVSLHTGLRYNFHCQNTTAQTFCTLSDNLDHQAHAVWEHMKPIFEESSKSFPDTHTVHIFSDSPSSQYRNRTNLFLMKTMLPTYFKNLKSFTWNFSEPGHGKGAMDGVGGSLKRNADFAVKHGKDITCAADLVATLGPRSKTTLLEIPYEAIESAKKSLPTNIPPVKGIMSIRQITFDGVSRSIFGRKLSCFDCPVDTECAHFHLMKLPNWEKPPTKKAKKMNHKPKKPLSSLLDECSDISDDDDELQNLRPKRNKVVSYIEVFTSSEDEESESMVQNLPTIEPQPSCSGTGSGSLKMITGVVNNVELGTFVLVRFEAEGKKGMCHQFVGVCQGKNSDEGELEVMFLKSGAPNDKSLFVINEKDISTVDTSQIVAVLPNPNLILKGDRIFYKFKCTINVF